MPDAKKRIGAHELGIDLDRPTDAVVFRWLIACQLFGARIRQDIAAHAYRELERAGVLTPHKLADADWQRLVDLLGAGGYRRYDESTARQLIANGKLALERYGGKLTTLNDGVSSKRELRARIQEFEGVGPTAAGIFLRDMPATWQNVSRRRSG